MPGSCFIFRRLATRRSWGFSCPGIVRRGSAYKINQTTRLVTGQINTSFPTTLFSFVYHHCIFLCYSFGRHIPFTPTPVSPTTCFFFFFGINRNPVSGSFYPSSNHAFAQDIPSSSWFCISDHGRHHQDYCHGQQHLHPRLRRGKTRRRRRVSLPVRESQRRSWRLRLSLFSPPPWQWFLLGLLRCQGMRGCACFKTFDYQRIGC